MRFVVVNGPPGAGKSTLAVPLAERLGWPLVAKDTIKEALGDAFGDDAGPWSRRLGEASFEVLWAVAAQCPRAVLEGNFRPRSASTLLRLDPRPVEVFCRCPLDMCRARFAARLAAGGRHHVHPPEIPPFELFASHDAPLAVGPVLDVATDGPVDLEAVVDWVVAQ
jgi:predicted kinase